MAATDYVIVAGWRNAYLARKKKNQRNNTMSQDRRPITNSEIIGLFEFYLRNWCSENKKETVVITDANGKKLFEATLLDRE